MQGVLEIYDTLRSVCIPAARCALGKMETNQQGSAFSVTALWICRGLCFCLGCRLCSGIVYFWNCLLSAEDKSKVQKTLRVIYYLKKTFIMNSMLFIFAALVRKKGDCVWMYCKSYTHSIDTIILVHKIMYWNQYTVLSLLHCCAVYTKQKCCACLRINPRLCIVLLILILTFTSEVSLWQFLQERAIEENVRSGWSNLFLLALRKNVVKGSCRRWKWDIRTVKEPLKLEATVDLPASFVLFWAKLK